MHPLTVLVCGNLPNTGAIRDVIEHLGSTLDRLITKSLALRDHTDHADLTLFGPFLGRASLEVAFTAMVGRFDPYRVLAIRRSQLSDSYDLQSRNPLAFTWSGDVQGTGKPKDWSTISGIADVQRALLCGHFHDLFWEEAFIRMLDSTREHSGSEWLSSLRKLEPSNFTTRNRTEAARLYSEMSKAVHHEFVIPPEAQFDAITVNDLVSRSWELIAGLAITACHSPSLNAIPTEEIIKYYMQAQQELIR